MHKPIHKHDCDKCEFLGNFTPTEGNYVGYIYDLYYCPNEPTIIARHGENGEYLSGMIFGSIYKEDKNYPLAEAWRRAKEKGLKVK
jgi:hypothetical protein